MKEKLKQFLDSKNVFSGDLPDTLRKMTSSITGDVPDKMKLAIATSELVNFASQFRKDIKLSKHTYVPTNAISFIFAPSGASKDRTRDEMRNTLIEGYKQIDKFRENEAINKAIRIATAEGRENPDSPAVYKEFYNEPEDVFMSVTNEAAFSNHLYKINKNTPIGTGCVYTGELTTEMQTNADLVPTFRYMSELYDKGNRASKPLKGGGSTPALNRVGVNALLISSYIKLVEDTKLNEKFKSEFASALARRADVSFNPFPVEKEEIKDVEELLKASRAQAAKADEYLEELNEQSKQIAMFWCRPDAAKHLELSEEAQDIYTVYLEYNKILASEIPKTFPLSELSRAHMQWRALKIAGAFAVIRKSSTIEPLDLIHGISYCEFLGADLQELEEELMKEPYERFVDFMQYTAEDGKNSIGVHKLRKLGYIPTGTTSFLPKMRELASLAASYDTKGVYTVVDNDIQYEALVTTDAVFASFVAVSGSKEDRAKQCASGYDYVETTFDTLCDLLSNDFAYSPFKFKDGTRGKDNIESGTKWLCLDIDDSKITDEECHSMLREINHHIARTSDPDNPFKFRLIVELDSVVDIDSKHWKNFVKSVSDYLTVKADPLPKSQIYFGYEGRNVLSVTDGEIISSKEHLMFAYSEEASKPSNDVSKLTAKQKQELRDNTMETFIYAFECDSGEGSRSLIRAAYHAKDLGMSNDEIVNLMYEINNYWAVPMDQQRLENTIISQVKRF